MSITWADERVLVTGATGMVGSALVTRLVAEGAHVVAFVRDADPQSELIRSGLIHRVALVDGSLEDITSVVRAVNEHEVSTVLHLGAQTIVGVADRDPVATFSANVEGTWNVLEAVRRLDVLVERVVVASSDKAYGEHDDLPYTEEHPLEGRGPYEVSKSCADLVAQSYYHTYATPVAIARCGNVYGPGDLNWSRLVPGTVRSLLTGRQPVIRSDGTFVRDYLYVEDVVDAYLTLAAAIPERGVAGEAFNFSDESPMSVIEMYRAVCSAAGEEVEPRILDEAGGEIHDQYLDASKARDVLGWRVRYGLEEGLRRTIAWYRDVLGREGPAPNDG